LSEEAGQRKAALESQKLPEPMIRALWDRGEPSPTICIGGETSSVPGGSSVPAFLRFLTDGKTPFEVAPPWPEPKRPAAAWLWRGGLTRSDHPLTARVMVNRIWKHHFGVGLVKNSRQFRKNGNASDAS